MLIIRFIPAWAGHGQSTVHLPLAKPVHPRVGGARGVQRSCTHLSGGSSPRGRGTGLGAFHRKYHWRFIPAWAGHGDAPGSISVPQPVHPRVGGARDLLGWRGKRANGSSPRGRGTAQLQTQQESTDRFIPAWAGHGPSPPLALPCPPVHPRVGGARGTLNVGADVAYGSSPRGRGTAARSGFNRRQWSVHPRVGGARWAVHGDAWVQARFIPAWAGHGLL